MYHEERERQGRAMDIHLSDVKTVLMPRQHVLKALDPNGTATAEELRAKIVPLARIYHAVVLKDQLPADKGVEEALGIYRNFHMLMYIQTSSVRTAEVHRQNCGREEALQVSQGHCWQEKAEAPRGACG
jgi:hypothetical protein